MPSLLLRRTCNNKLMSANAISCGPCAPAFTQALLQLADGQLPWVSKLS